MTSYTIPNNIYLAKDALKYSEGPPELLIFLGHLFGDIFLSVELAVGVISKNL